MYIKKLLYLIQYILVLIFYILEFVIWKRIGLPIYDAIKSFRFMQLFKEWVSNLEHRYFVLYIFLLPFVLSEYISLIALKEFSNGFLLNAISLYVFKILLTIPVSIIFSASKKILLSFSVIKIVYILIIKIRKSQIFKTVKKKVKSSIINIKLFIQNTLKSDLKNIYAPFFIRTFKIIYKRINGFFNKRKD
jgi:hypothetical protein